jgi:hypothetical protein
MPVRPLARDEDGSLIWADALDAPTDWLDITQIRVSSTNYGQWSFELAAAPPRAAELDPAQTLISYGLVFETTGDGRPDYVVGINNNASVRGDYRVWVTDLATGATDERVGPPYGYPVEFRHPNEARPDDPPQSSKTVAFTFLGSPIPHGLAEDSPFYVWSAVTHADGTVAWDYAPDAAWLGLR